MIPVYARRQQLPRFSATVYHHHWPFVFIKRFPCKTTVPCWWKRGTGLLFAPFPQSVQNWLIIAPVCSVLCNVHTAITGLLPSWKTNTSDDTSDTHWRVPVRLNCVVRFNWGKNRDMDTNYCNGVNACSPQNASNIPSCPLPVQSDNLLVNRRVVPTSHPTDWRVLPSLASCCDGLSHIISVDSLYCRNRFMQSSRRLISLADW